MNIKQGLIDFCEIQMFICQDIAKRRAKKYGNKSWQWRITINQEILWDRLSWKILLI